MEIYTDYESMGNELFGNASNGIGEILGSIFAGLGIFFLIVIAISVFFTIVQWKIFKKANKPGWYSLIPIFNMWSLFEVSGLPGWLSVIPIANFFAMFVAYYKLTIKFGKSTVFAVCTLIFPIICLPILAFDQSVYVDNTENVNANVNADMNSNNNMYSYNNNVNNNGVTYDYNVNNLNNNSYDYNNNVNNNNTYDYNNTNSGINYDYNVNNVNNNINYDNNNNFNDYSQEQYQPNTYTQSNNQFVENEQFPIGKVCHNCQNNNSAMSLFCEKCGTRL